MEDMVDSNFWKNRKVLITGHTGFKGSWLCMILNRLESNVSGYALNPPTDPNLFDLCELKHIINSTISDIRDFQSLYNTIESEEPEIVFHLAAQPLVRESYLNPLETYQTNVIGTANLFEAIRMSKKKSVRVVVNVTTDKCYENKEWVWPYRENEPLGGYDPYSSSKACSELVTSAFRSSFFNIEEYHIHHVAVGTARAGNVIGGGDWANDRLIPDIIRSILSGKKIILRNPNSIRPWQHVLEPLSGYLQLAEGLYKNPQGISGAYNFGPDDSDAKTVEWIVQRFRQKLPDRVYYEIDKNHQPHEATYLRLDSSKSKSVLNWIPIWNIEVAIDSIIDFIIASQKDSANIRNICLAQIEKHLSMSSDLIKLVKL